MVEEVKTDEDLSEAENQEVGRVNLEEGLCALATSFLHVFVNLVSGGRK